MEIYLDRKLVDRRIFPSIDVNVSGTKNEELLVGQDVLNKMWILRFPISRIQHSEQKSICNNCLYIFNLPSSSLLCFSDLYHLRLYSLSVKLDETLRYMMKKLSSTIVSSKAYLKHPDKYLTSQKLNKGLQR